MGKMIRIGAWLLIAASPFILPASITVSSSVNGVALGGTHELAGSYALTIEADVFSGASPTEPVYIRLALDKNAVFSETRVDTNRADPLLANPIFAPLVLSGSEPGDTLLAPPTAAAIVRWVAGEPAIWLRIQSDSSGWIQLADGGVSGPSSDRPVRLNLGVNARVSVALIEDVPREQWNLPFHTRTPNQEALSAEDSVSTLFCVDLTRAALVPGTPDSLLYLDPFAFGPEAEIAPGIFQANQPLPDVNFVGVMSIGQGQRLSCEIQAQNPLPETLLTMPSGAEGLTVLANRLTLSFTVSPEDRAAMCLTWTSLTDRGWFCPPAVAAPTVFPKSLAGFSIRITSIVYKESVAIYQVVLAQPPKCLILPFTSGCPAVRCV